MNLRAWQGDQELVQGALRHDPEALEAFLQRMKCVPRMLAYKNARMGAPMNAQELEDVAQDILLAIWGKLRSYNGQGPLESWVYRFCFLELMARLRSRGRRQRLLQELPVPPSGTDSEPACERYEEVYRGLDNLGTEAASLLRLKHFEELTFEEIGVRLGLSANTAKTRYYRALPRLRQLLAEEALQEQGGER
jgi:RNA polymerase sigma-70 factor (ECF subfamily)